MKENIMVILRFFMEVCLFVVLLPLICLISLLVLLWIIMINNGTILDDFRIWTDILKRGIIQNIDFIKNGF